jgi:hypothetical protein
MKLETWELLSYIVTVFGLPLAILSFMLEQRKERENEDEEVYQLLTADYTDFLKLVIANPDLKLRSQREITDLSEEQRERMQVLYEILISLFERAYLLSYDENMSRKQERRWLSWEDFMRCTARIRTSRAISAGWPVKPYLPRQPGKAHRKASCRI